ncbi:hypothetical protein CC1G_09715 [Coprinopsis cinerea okayama7|uniref:Bromodomain associated domain-containing protein n=1 Tax=Coprinopsis cinerea (strain Okayama-7 / 130 / ATCC MYA-4618 / FGSC 9003) TaxID=240176 RepID=A8NJF8_COPC7|nr:hypothetical protein CC1G_09715 [Coprinopsis cinerea okayama7\|eukprot:XP_001834215.2 hypothetical protein CC1G_09715 [Coprinopsis cinerea okayama7\
MDANTHRLLESVTHRTLHAHAFSRASSQATLVLTDLLSRYLTLLTSSCARYAQHAGRHQLSIYDALQAIDELGTSVDELSEFGSTEGKEMNRYAVQSAKRIEELNEYRSHLFEGLRQDRDDAIALHFARFDEEGYVDSEDDEQSSEYSVSDDEVATQPATLPDAMEVDGQPVSPSLQKRRHVSSPKLPPSPVSKSPSPSRKRPRTANWNPPEHIPDFLPPFPSTDVAPPGSNHPSPRMSSQPPELRPPTPAPGTPEPTGAAAAEKAEKASLSLSQAIAANNTTSDILVQVPYAQSTLAGIPERHLPGPPPSRPPPRPPRFATPQTEPSFIGAYHYILTHPPPPHPPPATTQRHRVAMALLDLLQKQSRWTPADTLNASVAPCPPRVATMSPSCPVAISDLGPDGKPRDGKEDRTKFPMTSMKPVAYPERLAPMASQPSSHIPDLARLVLHPAILSRSTRLTHPPMLYRGSKPLVYGRGVPAPWNVAPLPDPANPSTPSSSKPNGKDKETDPDAPKPAMADALLFATWDYDKKDYRVPLPRHGSRNRVAGGSGVITLGGSRKGHK